jgi:hypothetical protein
VADRDGRDTLKYIVAARVKSWTAAIERRPGDHTMVAIELGDQGTKQDKMSGTTRDCACTSTIERDPNLTHRSGSPTLPERVIQDKSIAAMDI